MRVKLLSSFLFIFFLAVLLPTAYFASAESSLTKKQEIEVLNQEISQRKDKIKQLEETIDSYKKTIAQKQNESFSLRNQLSILDNYVAQITADLEATQEKIKTTQLEIEALQLSIKDKNVIIDRQKKIIAKLVQNIHASDQKNYLEILLTYDTFADFYNEFKYTENIYVDLGRSVKIVRLAKEELERKQAQVEDKQQTLAKFKEQLEGKQEKLAENIKYKQTVLVQTKSSERTYQTLLSSLKQQYQVIEGEVRTFEERVRKKLAEEDRIQAGGSVAMDWPVPSRFITTLFHDPEYPFRNVFEHSGIDIRASQGTPVRAAAAGYIGRARRCSSASCYSYILIIHTGNISSLYGHLSNITVSDDAFVNRGDVIGYSGGIPGTVGAGPFVTGPHMHFEVRLNGIPVDPLGYLVQ